MYRDVLFNVKMIFEWLHKFNNQWPYFPNFVVALLTSIGPGRIHNYCQQDVYGSIVDAILLK